MFTSSDMQKIEIVALNKDKLDVLSELQMQGVMQVTQPSEYLAKELERSSPPEIMADLADYSTKMSRIKSVLDLVESKKEFHQIPVREIIQQRK